MSDNSYEGLAAEVNKLGKRQKYLNWSIFLLPVVVLVDRERALPIALPLMILWSAFSYINGNTMIQRLRQILELLEAAVPRKQRPIDMWADHLNLVTTGRNCAIIIGASSLVFLGCWAITEIGINKEAYSLGLIAFCGGIIFAGTRLRHVALENQIRASAREAERRSEESQLLK